MNRRKVLRVLNVLTLVLLFAGFTIEICMYFDYVLCFTVRRVFGWSPVILGIMATVVTIAAILVNTVIACLGKFNKLRVGLVMLLAVILTPISAAVLDSHSPYRTMRPGLDEEFFIDEHGSVVGEKLGTYAIKVPTEGMSVKAYWQCISVTSYGPVRYRDELDECFISVDSRGVLAVSFDEYADGVWITVKEFTYKYDLLEVFISEDDTKIVAEYLDSISHEVVNFSGKTDSEISEILETATWNTVSWTTDELEQMKTE